MSYISTFIVDFIDIFNEMSPYLLLGFLFAGLLKVFLPQRFIDNNLAKPNFKSVLYASLLGIPMPLCSCGVIPTGVSIHKNGASKGATNSFLISTPQTGVDSILATYSLLGLPFAIIRPLVALFTGVLGGMLTNQLESKKESQPTNLEVETCSDGSCSTNENALLEQNNSSKFKQVFQYAFVDFLQDIYKWLLIGLLLATVISVLVPNNFFEHFIGNQMLEMALILLVAIPIYVCATGSIPIVAVLMLKGLSAGAGLVFLMAGPATNIATITVLRKTLGKKAMWSYLLSIIIGAILFGALINYFLPKSWFDIQHITHIHNHFQLPVWLKYSSTIILLLLIINAHINRKIDKLNTENRNMNTKTVAIDGMNCNHCKNSVEKTISQLDGIDVVNVNLEQKIAVLEGKNIDLEKVKTEIETLGFQYKGEK